MTLPAHRNSFTDHINFLRGVPPFEKLSEKELAAIAGDLRLRHYGPNEIIFRQGDDSRELYVIKEGKVRIFKISPGGNETSIQIFAAGDIVGEFAAIDSRSRSATARAIGKCGLLGLTQTAFLKHLGEIPALALGLTRLLVTKVRWTAEYAETIAQYDTPGRLLHILLFYNQQFGEQIVEGEKYILDLGLNQTDLASLVGTRREWINRTLKGWGNRELIEFRDGKIIILDLPRVIAERDSHIQALAET